MCVVHFFLVICACVVSSQSDHKVFKGCPFIQNIANYSMAEITRLFKDEPLENLSVCDSEKARLIYNVTDVCPSYGFIAGFTNVKLLGPIRPSTTPDNNTILSFDLCLAPMEIIFENLGNQNIFVNLTGDLLYLAIDENIINCVLYVKMNFTSKLLEVKTVNVTLIKLGKGEGKLMKDKEGQENELVTRNLPDNVTEVLVLNMMDAVKETVEKKIKNGIDRTLKTEKILEMCKEMFRKGSKV